MYINLYDYRYYFEDVLMNGPKYFNMEDYRIYSLEERQELINADTYKANDFLLIPQKSFTEIVEKYLISINNRSLLRKKWDKDFYRTFHWYTEDNHLVNDWKRFEESELIAFASEWCEQNKINYTVK